LSAEDAATLRPALDDGGDFYQTANAVGQVLGESPPPASHAVMRALQYHMRLDDDASEGPYGPMMEWANGAAYPERLDDVTDNTLAVWASALGHLGDVPIVTARLGDLLWLRRYGDKPYLFAVAAHDAMCELSAGDRLNDIEKTDVLRRALTIALEINDKTRLAATIDLVLGLAERTLDAGAEKPGVTMRLLDALAALPVPHRPTDLDERLERAATVYTDDPFIVDAIIDTRLALLPPDEPRAVALRRDASRIWEEAADRESGLRRLMHLQRAIDQAREHGESDELERLRAKAQTSAESEELGLQAVSATIEIPREKVERFLGAFTAGDDPLSWLTRFAAYCPVPADPEKSAAEARQMMKAHPLQYLTTKVVVDRDNLPLAIIRDEDEHLRVAIIENESRAIEVWATFAVDILRAIQQKGGADRSVLLAFLTRGGLIDAAVAEKFANAFDHFWQGRYDEASLVALPRIETVLRTAARRLGIRTYTEPGAGRAVGRHAALGDLLAKVEGRVPEDHRRFLRVVLTEQLALNIRNRLLHGLSVDTTPHEAALVLQMASLLAVWEFGRASPREPGDEPSDL
jgi:hypothetical protein